MARRIIPHEELIGKRFGRLVVQSVLPVSRLPRQYLCLCDCGRQSTPAKGSLLGGRTRSCGCLEAETRKRGFGRKHGYYSHPLYNLWRKMIERCYKHTNIGYRNYGARGIKVCEAWKTSFESFVADMGSRPSLDHSVDRIDNDGDYEPGNCRWATPKEQRRNARDNRVLEFRGIRKCVSEWADELGMTDDVILKRLKYGWSVEEALTTPYQRGKHNKPKGRHRRDRRRGDVARMD